MVYINIILPESISLNNIIKIALNNFLFEVIKNNLKQFLKRSEEVEPLQVDLGPPGAAHHVGDVGWVVPHDVDVFVRRKKLANARNLFKVF